MRIIGVNLRRFLVPPSEIGALYLDSARKRFETLKRMAERAMDQVNEADLDWAFNSECNSLQIQVQHLHGNMVSRWTDPLNTDGEKPDRRRDEEFIASGYMGRGELMALWEEGWGTLMSALISFSPEDLARTIHIRGEAHTLIDAINRQLMHTAYHVGQIVHLAKERVGERWQTLSIARGKSSGFRPEGQNAWKTR
jgi:hypothetical protein